jgi:hypothetical protein
LWTKLRSAGAPLDKEPDEKVLSPTLLLTVVSPEFRQALKDEIASTAAQSMRCDWYAVLRGSDGPGAIVIMRRVRDVAMREGEEEIKAAQQLSGEIKSLISDFGEVLAADPEYHGAINALRQAVGANVARKSRELSQSVRQVLFAKAKEALATGQLKRLRRRWSLEILVDGAILASLFTLARYIIGEVITGDGFAYVWLLAQSDAFSLTVGGLLVVVTVLGLVGHSAAVKIAERFVGGGGSHQGES